MAKKYMWKVSTTSDQELEKTLNELEEAGFEIYQIEHKELQFKSMYGYDIVVTSRQLVAQPSVYEKKPLVTV